MRICNYFYLCLLLSVISCGPRERVSKEVFDAVNKHMEAKKLSDSQIMEGAIVWGDSIAEAAQFQFITKLQNAVKERGIVEAVPFCNLEGTQITADLESQFGISIKRVASRARNKSNLPIGMEIELLDAYKYNAENDIANRPNIQKIEDGKVLLYTKAIVIKDKFCLSCHGIPKVDIQPQTLKKINELYPQDSAKNFAVGDLRGMWSIRLPKKEVVIKL